MQSGRGRPVAKSAVIREATEQQGGTIPVIAEVSREGSLSEADTRGLLEAGSDGVALYYERLDQTAASFSGRSDSEASHPVSSLCPCLPSRTYK